MATAQKEVKRTAPQGKIALAEIAPIPSLERYAEVAIEVDKAVPQDADCVAVPVGIDGEVPPQIDLDRDTLAASGFEGSVGQVLVLPRRDAPTIVAVGIGSRKEVDAAKLRDAAAAFSRAARRHAHLAWMLPDASTPPAEQAAQAIVEGVLLASYRFDALKEEIVGRELSRLTLVGAPDKQAALKKGADRGRIFATAAMVVRDLADAPPAYLTASRLADVATDLARERGLTIEVFDQDALLELGCGGILGVNAGSVEPARMIRIRYKPKSAGGKGRKDAGHLILVGKGIMYDSGGISLKPGDASHATMKQDMSGAAAVLGAMCALSELECPTAVTGYLMCTDNMPSGSAMKLGDVLKIYGGKTVEVLNTDAEGRLVMSDGLVMASEEKPDAIVTIATLTGACLRALGKDMAGVLGNDQPLVDQVAAAADRTDEKVWQFPLHRNYRKELNSEVADMKNIGGDFAGQIVAALFLEEFVGDVPWAHIDMAGTANIDKDESWRSKGASGYGTRLLIDMAMNFTPPRA